MDAWAWYWLLWFILALLAFAIPEYVAIRSRNKQTLSHHVWQLLDSPWRVPVTILLIGTTGWLIIHFLARY
jgi:hypothetical protein